MTGNLKGINATIFVQTTYGFLCGVRRCRPMVRIGNASSWRKTESVLESPTYGYGSPWGDVAIKEHAAAGELEFATGICRKISRTRPVGAVVRTTGPDGLLKNGKLIQADRFVVATDGRAVGLGANIK